MRLIRRCGDRENEEQNSHPMRLVTCIRVTVRVPVQKDRCEKLLKELATRQRPEEPCEVNDVALTQG